MDILTKHKEFKERYIGLKNPQELVELHFDLLTFNEERSKDCHFDPNLNLYTRQLQKYCENEIQAIANSPGIEFRGNWKKNNNPEEQLVAMTKKEFYQSEGYELTLPDNDGIGYRLILPNGTRVWAGKIILAAGEPSPGSTIIT